MINFLRDNPLFGLLGAMFSAAVNSVKREHIIPPGVEEVTMYIASVLAVGIALLTLIGLIRKEFKAYRARNN